MTSRSLLLPISACRFNTIHTSEFKLIFLFRCSSRLRSLIVLIGDTKLIMFIFFCFLFLNSRFTRSFQEKMSNRHRPVLHDLYLLFPKLHFISPFARIVFTFGFRRRPTPHCTVPQWCPFSTGFLFSIFIILTHPYYVEPIDRK